MPNVKVGASKRLLPYFSLLESTQEIFPVQCDSPQPSIRRLIYAGGLQSRASGFFIKKRRPRTAALLLVSAERARDLAQKPAYLLGVAQGSGHRAAAGAHNAPDYATANFKTVAPHLYAMAGVSPADVDVVQSYENFTGGVVMSLIEHGFAKPDEVNELCRFENLIAPSGRLPLNTSGGNLAECYMHGLELQVEAVRQLRGTSTSQVPDASVALVGSGPMVTPVSSMILGGEETLS